MWVFFYNPSYIQQGFGDTKGVIRIRKSKKDRQTTTQCPKKKDKQRSTKNKLHRKLKMELH